MTMSTCNRITLQRLTKHNHFQTHKQWPILEDWLSVWRSLGEYDDQDDVLELGDCKDGEVLQGGHRILFLCAYITSPVTEVDCEIFSTTQEYCEG